MNIFSNVEKQTSNPAGLSSVPAAFQSSFLPHMVGSLTQQAALLPCLLNDQGDHLMTTTRSAGFAVVE